MKLRLTWKTTEGVRPQTCCSASPGLCSAKASPPPHIACCAPGCMETSQSIYKARRTSPPWSSKAWSAGGLCPLPALALAALLLLLFALASPGLHPASRAQWPWVRQSGMEARGVGQGGSPWGKENRKGNGEVNGWLGGWGTPALP